MGLGFLGTWSPSLAQGPVQAPETGSESGGWRRGSPQEAGRRPRKGDLSFQHGRCLWRQRKLVRSVQMGPPRPPPPSPDLHVSLTPSEDKWIWRPENF